MELNLSVVVIASSFKTSGIAGSSATRKQRKIPFLSWKVQVNLYFQVFCKRLGKTTMVNMNQLMHEICDAFHKDIFGTALIIFDEASLQKYFNEF